MQELSLNILDIAQNSLAAHAKLVCISIEESERLLELTIFDDGCGMSREMVERVADPFCTTRKTRRVGLGIPFLKMQSEITGGRFSISSKSELEYPSDHGTITYASFQKDHIDCLPLGDIVSTVCTLIGGAGDTDILFTHTSDKLCVKLDTREMRKVLEGVSLCEPEVLLWAREYLREQYETYK